MDNEVDSLSDEISRRALTFDGQPVTVEIDFAALDTNSTMLDFHIRGAHAIVLVYSINSDASFRQLFPMVRALEKRPDSPPLMTVIGNKKDYLSRREVSAEVGQQLARQHGLDFAEGSIHDVQHLESVFTGIVRELRSRQTASADVPLESRPRISTSSNRSHLRKPGGGFFSALRRKLSLGRRQKEPEVPRGVLRKRGPSPGFEEPPTKRVDLKLDVDLGDSLDANRVYQNTIRRYR